MARFFLILAVLTSFVVSVTPAGAQSRPHGQSYSEWAADWWTWALSQPAATNPVLDPTGEQCAVGQQGDVWFLAGTFDTGPVVRDCTVPAGTALLIPVINEFYCAQVTDPAEQRTETYARAQVADVQTGATDLSVTIDGEPVQSLHYEESVMFSVVLPAGNIFGLPAGELLDPCVDAGYYTLVRPLSVGEHTIRIQGTNGSFSIDVTYNLTVVPRG